MRAKVRVCCVSQYLVAGQTSVNVQVVAQFRRLQALALAWKEVGRFRPAAAERFGGGMTQKLQSLSLMASVSSCFAQSVSLCVPSHALTARGHIALSASSIVSSFRRRHLQACCPVIRIECVQHKRRGLHVLQPAGQVCPDVVNLHVAADSSCESPHTSMNCTRALR